MQKSARKPTLKWETHTILWVLEYLLKCKIIRVEYMEKIAEPQGMWSSNFLQAAQAQHFFYL